MTKRAIAIGIGMLLAALNAGSFVWALDCRLPAPGKLWSLLGEQEDDASLDSSLRDGPNTYFWTAPGEMRVMRTGDEVTSFPDGSCESRLSTKEGEVVIVQRPHPLPLPYTRIVAATAADISTINFETYRKSFADDCTMLDGGVASFGPREQKQEPGSGAMWEEDTCSAAPLARTLPPPPSTSLNAVDVYPNPWRADLNSSDRVSFNNLPEGGAVKMFTVSARYVKSLPPTVPQTAWDLTNDAGQNVASGIYLYLISDGHGNHRTGQITVIR